jgi:hypothetical protein
MHKILFILGLISLVSCGSDKDSDQDAGKNGKDSLDVSKIDGHDTLKIKSDYGMGTVDVKERKEFRENLVKIEKKHGIQWDFCSCVVANDSINTVLKVANLPDSKLDKLLDRLTVVEEKCQAFLVQSPDRTPDERARHEKKVRDCLKAAKASKIQ